MNTRIFIENHELDVDAGITQQITYAIDDIRNVDSKATSITKTIVLPGTANNNALLGNIFEFNNSNFTTDSTSNVGYNFNAARSARCRIDVDGLTVIKGSFRLMEIIIDGQRIEYEAVVVGELGGFVAALGNAKLSDLDFSDYDHVFNESNITASWDNYNAGAGYYYPLIDYGNYSTAKKNWKVGTFRPALFVKEILEKIATDSGYTFDFPLLSTERFKRLIIPNNQKLLYNRDTRAFQALITGGDSFSGNTPELISFNAIVAAGGFTASGGNTVFTYSGDNINGSIEVSMQVTNYTNASAPPYELRVLKNGVMQGYALVVLESLPGTITFSIPITIVSGDYISLQLYPPPSPSATLDVSTTIFTVLTNTAQPVQVNYGETVNINGALPQNILQKDFFVSVLKLFNLYVDEDRYTEKHLIIKPYPDYYTGAVEDWSLKIDRAHPIRIKPMSELNARYYGFKFKQDSDYWNDLYRKRYNEGYGDRTFDSTFEFTAETQTTEVIFAATPLVGYSGEDKIYSTIFKRTGNEPTTTEEQIDSVIRILQAKKITGVDTWKIRNQADNADLHSGTVFPYAGHLDDPYTPTNDLNFGAPREVFFTLTGGDLSTNQFNVYYSGYMAEITDKDSRLLTCDVMLNDTEVFNLDFSTFKYIDGGLYRLVRLIDYTPGSFNTIRAELLRVVNTDY